MASKLFHVAPKEYTAAGRWNGRLTGKPLPKTDHDINALSCSLRERLSAAWHERSSLERRVADSFEVVVGALERRGAAPESIALAKRAVDDEYRHEELSRVVASRYAGYDLPRAPRLALIAPTYEGESQAIRDSLAIVGQCVFNETTAAASLEISLQHAKTRMARAALSELLSDHIDHGRIGWAHLASLTPAEKTQLEPWLLPLAHLDLRDRRRETPSHAGHEALLSDHGEPPAHVLQAALVDALRASIVPRLAKLGFDVAPIVAWLDAGADTTRPPVAQAA